MISAEMSSYGGHLFTFEIGYWDYLKAVQNLSMTHAYHTIAYHADFLSVDLERLGIEKIDMVLIDGRKNQYKDYLLRVANIVTSDSVIIIDDAIKFAHKTTSLYEYLAEKQIQYELLESEPGDGIIVIRNAGTQLLS